MSKCYPRQLDHLPGEKLCSPIFDKKNGIISHSKSGFSTVFAAMTLGEITACKESTVMVPVVCLCSDKSVDLWI